MWWIAWNENKTDESNPIGSNANGIFLLAFLCNFSFIIVYLEKQSITMMIKTTARRLFLSVALYMLQIGIVLAQTYNISVSEVY